jgi:hypothetical protein
LYELVNEQEIGRKVKPLRRTEVDEGGREINTWGERQREKEVNGDKDKERERERANCIKERKGNVKVSE